MNRKITTFSFNKELYSKEALLKAAYQFTDTFYVHLSVHDDAYYVSLSPKASAVISEEEFKNEMLAQMVRSYISNQTKDLRTLLMARAFSSSVIEQSTSESGSDSIDSQEVILQEEILKDWFDTNA